MPYRYSFETEAQYLQRMEQDYGFVPPQAVPEAAVPASTVSIAVPNSPAPAASLFVVPWWGMAAFLLLVAALVFYEQHRRKLTRLAKNLAVHLDAATVQVAVEQADLASRPKKAKSAKRAPGPAFDPVVVVTRRWQPSSGRGRRVG